MSTGICLYDGNFCGQNKPVTLQKNADELKSEKKGGGTRTRTRTYIIHILNHESDVYKWLQEAGECGDGHLSRSSRTYIVHTNIEVSCKSRLLISISVHISIVLSSI